MDRINNGINLNFVCLSFVVLRGKSRVWCVNEVATAGQTDM